MISFTLPVLLPVETWHAMCSVQFVFHNFEVVKLNNGLNNKDTQAVSSLLFTDVTDLM